MPVRLYDRAADFAERFARFVAAQREVLADVEEAVGAILARVKEEGDAAVVDCTLEFDRFVVTAEHLRIPVEEIDEAAAACAPVTLDALKFAADRIEAFHRQQLPQGLDYRDDAGLRLGLRWTPIESVGLYVPGGRAAYPSSVLMNAIPARVAGVDRVVMTVPTPGGDLDPNVLAAATIAGIDEIYRIGGAQAVGALAYGTQSIPAVDKIVGPGNAYVAAAKRQVYGTVGIDSLAGPSEILVVADSANDPDWIAADLLSQSEHDTASQAILITDDEAFADEVEAAVDHRLKSLPRGEIARQSWQWHGAVIILADMVNVQPLVDSIAPEHLELAIADPEALASKIRNAGAIFLGRYAPEAIGDYVAGPNHVLPTSRSARFSSGLSVLDFMKRTSIVGCDLAGLQAVGPAAIELARAEGLDAHALSLSLRLEQGRD